MKDLTPRRIVEYLDEYIVGQQNAKRSVAVALRNRWRSSRLPKEIAREVSPKNILLIGPTGVGKTEIARRIAALTGAPFVKVEATKYTEVGYVGRDVESMVRDLAEEAVRLVKKQESGRHGKDAEEAAVQKIAEIMWPAKKKETRSPMEIILGEKAEKTGVSDEGERERRKNLLARIRSGELDDRQIEVELEEKGNIEDTADNEQANRISQIFASMMPKKMKKRKMTVRMAKTVLAEVSAEEMVDMDVVRDRAVALAEERGIIFIDEIDKVASKSERSSGIDVSREGVQRDILPIVEGSKVNTKFGVVDTRHILFIAAGAFSISKPSDLIPEFQGRFPLRVELESLHAEDFKRILLEPKNALTKQYKALLETEGLTVIFKDEAIDRMSNLAAEVNSTMENIGARRLHTIMEMLLEDISFNASDMTEKTVEIDRAYVDERLKNIVQDQDLSRYIL